MNEPAKSPELGSLATKLELCPEVVRFDHEGEPEAWALAQALTDIEESFPRFQQLMGHLRQATDSETVYGILLDIGEELRHLAYHISASRFYSYVSPAKDSS